MRKAWAVLLAGLIALGAVISQGGQAYAAGSCTIKITKGSNDTGGIDGKREYKAYQLFSGMVSGEMLSSVEWGTGVDSAALLAALQVYEEADHTQPFAGCTTADDVSKVLMAKGTAADGDSEAAAAAKKAFRLAMASLIGNCLSSTSKDSSYDSAGFYKIENVDAGYYLIRETTAADVLAGNARSRNMLLVVGTNTEIATSNKRAVPSLTKKILDNGEKNANEGGIGDVVDYKLASVVPDMTGYSKYFFIFEDTMDKGLTLNADSFVVTVDGTKVESDQYTVTQSGIYGAQTSFKLVMKDFIQYQDKQGKEVVVTYSATLNEYADVVNRGNIADGGDKNTAYIRFSNDPTYEYNGENEPDDGEPTGETPKQSVITFSTQVKLTKTDGNDESKKLEGVVFQIYGEPLQNILVDGVYYRKSSSGTYYLKKDGTYTDTAPVAATEAEYLSATLKYERVDAPSDDFKKLVVKTYATTDANGVLAFEGLGVGDYYIREVSTIAGYNLLTEPKKIEIRAAIKQDEKTCEWSEASDSLINYSPTENAITMKVVNNQGATLPSTGGIGTTIFYVLGGILVCGAAVLLVTRKRMSCEEQETED